MKKYIIAMHGDLGHETTYAFDESDSRVQNRRNTELVHKIGKGISEFNGRKVVIAANFNSKYEIFSDRSARKII